MLNQASSIVVNVLVNSSGANVGVQQFNQTMLRIQVIAQNAAQNSANSFASIFGGNFFANLASNMVQAMASGFESLVSQAIGAASKLESALAGVGGTAKNLGLSPTDVVDSVRGLDLVKNGLLNITDAALATKNLLASGFSLPQGIELIKRFGDTAAFGRQASLSFGYAISSATEGIKNQNSILVDNAGVTKNLSVILRERGFVLQDLSDKTKGASAREALYQGLIKETQNQLGDSNKLLATTQGGFLRVSAASERFLVSLGEIVTKSAAASAGLGAVVSVLDFAAQNVKTVLALAASVGVLTVAAALSTTSFTAFSFAEAGAALAGSGLAKVLTAVPLLLADINYAAALTTGELVLLSGGALAVIVGVGALVSALVSYGSTQEDVVKVTQESISTMISARDNYSAQVEALAGLSGGNVDLTTKQALLEAAYRGVNVQSQERVVGATSEAEKIRLLTEEYKRLANAQNQKLGTTSRLTAENLLGEIGKFQTASAGQLAAQQSAQKLQDEANRYRANPNAVISEDQPNGRTRTFTGSQFVGVLESQRAAQDKTFSALGEQMDTAKAAAKDYNTQLELLAKTQGVSVEQAIQQKFAFEGNAGAAEAAISSYHQFISSQNLGEKAVVSTTNAINEQINAINNLASSAANKERKEAVSGLVAQIAEANAGTPEKAKGALAEAIKGNPAVGENIKLIQGYDKALKSLNETVSPKEEKKHKSYSQTLGDGFKKLSAEVNSYRNLTSKDFEVRFKREELERTKRDFEKIIDLRRELGLALNTPLPTGASGGRGEIEHLETVKRLRDDVLKNYRQTADAEEKLLVARLSANAAVVSAETRANTAYFENIRARKDAEAQLTSDLAAEFRKRAEFSSNFVNIQANAQADALKESLAEKTTQDTDRLKTVARLQILAGEVFADNPLVKAAAAISSQKPDVSPVVGRLDKGNGLLTEILNAVKASGLKGSDGAAASPFLGSGSGIFRGSNRLNTTSRNAKYDALYAKYGAQYGVDPNVLLEQGRQESINFKPSVINTSLSSPVGAKGISQFMAGTAARFGVNVRDVESSIRGQAQYMALLLKKFDGDYRLALAGYNAGEGRGNFKSSEARLNYFLKNVKETRNYSPTILGKAAAAIGARETVVPVKLVSVDDAAKPPRGGAAYSGAPEESRRLPPTLDAVTPLSRKFFGQSTEFLSPESLGALGEYVKAMAAYKELGATDAERTKNLGLQAAGQDRINQILNVRYKQTADLAVVETRINKLLRGDSVSVTEALNDAELARGRQYEANLKTLITTKSYLDRLRSGDKSTIGQIITDADAERATATAKAYEDIAKAKSFLEKFRAGDSEVLEFLRKSSDSARSNQVVGLTTDVFKAREKNQRGARDPQIEALELEKESLNTLNSVGEATSKLEQLESLRADRNVVRAKQTSGVLNEEYDIKRKLADLEDERSTIGENAGLRAYAAAQDERNQVLRENSRATEEAARARVRLQDSEVLNVETANSKVLQHIAAVKSLTEVYADAKIGIVDKVYGGIDALFDKLTSKIPIVGSVLKDILSNIVKLAANKFLLKLLGLEGSGNTFVPANTGAGGGGFFGGGASGGGSASPAPAFNPIQFLSGLGGGGSSAGGVAGFGGGGFRTPSFNPNASASGVGVPFGGFGGGSANAGLGGSNLSALGGVSQFLNFFASSATGGNSARPALGNAGGYVSAGLGDYKPGGGGAAGLSGQGIGGLLKSLTKGGFKSGIGGALAGLLPGLGGGVGAAIGGGGGVGGILGGAGGALAGLLGSSLLTGGAASLFGGVFAGSGALAIGSLGAALSATVVLAPIAAALLIGGYFINRSNVRRKEETQRTTAMNDARAALQKILSDLKASSNPDDVKSAIDQATKIRADYLQQVSQLKDAKTRRIAQGAVSELDFFIGQIRGEGENVKARSRKQNYAAAFDNALVPTFDGGGIYDYAIRTPSMNRRSANDTHYAYNPTTEAVLTRQNIYALGGYPALAAAGVRGASSYSPVNTANSFSSNASASAATGEASKVPIMNIIVFDEAAKKKLVDKFSGRAILNVIKPLISSGQDDGFSDAVFGNATGQ